MSVKLFYENPYLNKWTAKIESIDKKGENYVITLNKTYFYSEGGGQPADSGSINGIKVIDVFEEENVIYHVLKEKPEGTEANCIIDFEKRFDHMQQHSGEHLLSGVFYKLFGGQNVGFHMGADYVTIDISLADISEEMIAKAENTACDVIYENIDVNTYVIRDGELSSIVLRKECKVKGDIRIVEIGDVDCIACCGTHVKKTGEIGLIKIIKAEKYKGMTRIYFKCGKRAQKDYQSKHNIITSLSRLYLSPENDVLDRAVNESNILKSYEKEIKNLKSIILNYEAENMIKSYPDGLIIKEFEDKNSADLQLLSKMILDKGNFTVVFGSTSEKKLLFANNRDKNIVCGKVFKETLPLYRGRGGGNEKQAQAEFVTLEDMRRYSEYIKKLTEKSRG